MHGLGNDFVIIDCRSENYSFAAGEIAAIADRHTGVGCDQFVLLKKSDAADCFVQFYNEDGSQSSACGNATRCVAAIIMQEKASNKATLQTNAGILNCVQNDNLQISVEMGQYVDDWRQIPLASESDTLHVEVASGALSDAVAVNIGNPHAVFFVEDNTKIDLAKDGGFLETHPIFPERANIGVASVSSKTAINLRVWERGVGETKACGTGACAAAIAAVRRGLCSCDADITISLAGGDLIIKVLQNKNVTMTGLVTFVFDGSFDLNHFRVGA